MSKALLIRIQFHDDRYHGTGDWPPSPARLFQALVAASSGVALTEIRQKAFCWLERLPQAPIIAAPVVRPGQSLNTYVPNNDLDGVGGDVKRIGEIRVAKAIRPMLFDASGLLLYAWSYESSAENEADASEICRAADGLYQLGRGVDMAWASAELIDSVQLEDYLARSTGVIHRPNKNSINATLDCPQPGSFESLEARYQAGQKRFKSIGTAQKPQQLFSQASKPLFQQVSYASASTRFLFDVRETTHKDAPFAPQQLTEVAALTRLLRGNDGSDGTPASGAYKRLTDSLGTAKHNLIQRILIGRNASEADKSQRIRILPLASIGHEHADMRIRRVLVEVPSNCPLRADDIVWAFSGLVVSQSVDSESGEITQVQLLPSLERTMLEHYGVGKEYHAKIWRTLTPVVLPEAAACRRIEPKQRSLQAKGGAEYLSEVHQASAALKQALRHVKVGSKVLLVRVQREPLSARGARAQDFAAGTRFSKERLWHAEIEFAEAVSGPLILGDGRYAGLGVCAPKLPQVNGVFGLSIVSGMNETANPAELASALRRAVMWLVQERLGRNTRLSTFFSGHANNGAPAAAGKHEHLTFIADLPRQRLLIVAPHVLEHRAASRNEENDLVALEAAIAQLRVLRAAENGCLNIEPLGVITEDDALFRASRIWRSVTPFAVTRHAKKTSVEDALMTDAIDELMRRGLPRPVKIEVVRVCKGPRGGLTGELQIEFSTAVNGPILLGRTLHLGGGFFSANYP